MKVAIILPSLVRSGPILVAQQLVNTLKHQVEFEVFYFDDVVEVDFDCPTKQISFYKVSDFSKFDLVHTHMLRPDMYFYWHYNSIKKKGISTLHQYIQVSLSYSYNKFIGVFFSLVWLLGLKKHTAIACINADMCRQYQNDFGNDKVTTIYNGVPSVSTHEICNEDSVLINNLKNQNLKIVITIAELNKRKGLEQMIPVIKDNADWVYLVIGKGAEFDTLQAEIVKNNIQDRFILLGFKSNATSYLHYADVYLMPSRSEGFGLALVEAASCKLPLVCSNISSFNEMFSWNEACFFELDNKEEIMMALTKAYDNSVLFGNNAYNRYLNSYTSSIMANNYLALYLQVVN